MNSPSRCSQPVSSLLVLMFTHRSSAFIQAFAGLGRPGSPLLPASCDVGSCACRTSYRQQLRESAAIRAARTDGGLGGGVETEDLGLDGDWELETGEASPGSPVGDDTPGSLPRKTMDGQDWVEWAREWREDPEGKADRLVKQWDAESAERDAQKTQANRKERRKTGSNKTPSNGFGGGKGDRATKGAPMGLTVTDVSGGDDGNIGDVVDWSRGQQLVEGDREKHFAAQWQGEADRINSLNPNDRDQLATNIRQALGGGKNNKNNKSARKKGRNNKNTPSERSANPKGFGSRSGGGVPVVGRRQEVRQSASSDSANPAVGDVQLPKADSSDSTTRINGVPDGGVVLPTLDVEGVEAPADDAEDAVVSGDTQDTSPRGNAQKVDGNLARMRGSFGKGVAAVVPDAESQIVPPEISSESITRDADEEISDGLADVRKIGKGVFDSRRKCDG